MNKAEPTASPTASQLITNHIAELADWRGKMLARLRQLILAAAPGLTEEWKWGTPVWSQKLFETLATISAEEASVPVGGKCATSAVQVKHVAFYLDVLEHNVRTQQYERQDWGKIWRETSAVTPEEWNAIKTQLRESYDRIKQLVADTTDWPSEDHLVGAIAVAMHTAYHLGEIRQALCTLQTE